MEGSIVDKTITRVGFGFMSEEEIRSLSVKEITSPHVFDNLDLPVPNGLYDPSLGPINNHDT